MSTATGSNQVTQAENQLRELLADHFEAALHQQAPTTSPLITVPPGVGKSTLATEFVNRYSSEHGLNSLTFVMSLDMDQEIYGREQWNKWLGHAKHGCGVYSAKSNLINKGFRPFVKCNCNYRSQFVSDKPTSAAINYADSELAESDNYIAEAISKFGLRIIDEIDWGRFFDKHNISRKWVESAIDSHPSKLVQIICVQIDRVGNGLSQGESISGRELYRLLELSREQIEIFAHSEPVRSVWDSSVENFPVKLAEIMGFESACIATGQSFNRRLWLSGTADGYFLNMQWFKRPAFIAPTLILDATATPRLVRRGFGLPDLPKPTEVQLGIPEHIRTLQYIDKRVGMTDFENNPTHFKDLLENWVSDWSRDSEIGIITWKKQVPLVTSWFEEWGFTNLAEPLHYWNLRSRNNLENVDYLVLFGCPTPDPYSFMDQARAFFYDSEQLPQNDWRTQSISAKGRKGTFSVNINAYDDQRLVELHEQACQMELLQAFHRSRPTRREKECTTIVVTSMPIPGVPIDQILGKRETQVEAIIAELSENESCKNAAVVRRMFGSELTERIRSSASKQLSFNRKKLIELVSATAFPIEYDAKRGFYRKDLGETLLDIHRESPKTDKFGQLGVIPDEIRVRSQWIFHRGKVPYGVDGWKISPTTPPGQGLVDLDLALTVLWKERFDGVGYLLNESDPYCVIDLDHCVDVGSGVIDESAQKIVNELDSYTEYSLSGDGLHIWVKASLANRIGRRTRGFEIYDHEHFMTVTGNHVPGTPLEINNRQSEVDATHTRVFGKMEPLPVKSTIVGSSQPSDNRIDQEVIEQCRIDYGDFEKLFDRGDWSSHPSQSEAEFRLCCIFADAVGNDSKRIDQLFRLSGLMRPKWSNGSNPTYGERTIANAIRLTISQ